MEQGLFTDQELETARRNLISLYETMFDSPMSIIRMYYNHSLLGLPSNDEQIKALKQVTKEDIMKVSKKIKKDTIVLIRGEQHEKN